MARPRQQSEQPTEDAVAAEETQADEAAPEAAPKGGEGAPTQKEEGGQTAYSVERLIAEAPSFLGYESHVVVGALHGTDKEFLTIDEAKAAVETWLGSDLTAKPSD